MQAQEDLIMIKGKRSKRPRPSSPLALTMATSSCSTAALSGGGVTSDVSGSSDQHINPSPSYSGALTESMQYHEDEEDMANCLILLAKGQRQTPPPPATSAPAMAEVYQCKTCNKSFGSFQALGGHRASHNKPYNKSLTLNDHGKKPSKIHKREDYFESNRDESTIITLQISNRVSGSCKNKLSRVHECSICGAGFASGQALGGHMRRHRPIAAAATTGHGGSREVMKKHRNLLSLDLNLPAPEDDERESKFHFSTQELVFSTSSLVDCLY